MKYLSFAMVRSASTHPGSKALRILVIDDEPAARDALSRLLGWHGFEVTSVGDGTSGVDVARHSRPDLILCDVNMPEVDGYSVLRSLKSDPNTAVIPFIFLSGVLDQDFVRQGMGLGADDYVTKPFQPEQLLDTIRARIERQQVITRKLHDLRLNLARSVPNEFFTPLNSILGFSMLLLDTLRSGEEVKRDDLEDSLAGIHHAGEQLLRLASNYVLFTQLASQEEPQDADKAIAAGETWVPAISRCIRNLAMSRGRMQDLHFSFEPVPLALSGEHLQKIVFELADNAFKFSRPNETVKTNGFLRDGVYVLQVCDRGCGMTPDQITSLDPMVQFDRVRLVQSGVGLGLAICQLLVRRYRGTIHFEPSAQKGLMVEVNLPLASISRLRND